PVKGGRAPAEVAQETSERGTVAVVVASLAPRLLQLGERRHQRLGRSEEHTSELQSRFDLVCRLLLEKKKKAHYRVLYHWTIHRLIDLASLTRYIMRLSCVPAPSLASLNHLSALRLSFSCSVFFIREA